MPRPLLGLDCIRGFGKPPTLNGSRNASRRRPAPSTVEVAPSQLAQLVARMGLGTVSSLSSVPSRPEENLIPTMSLASRRVL